MAAMVKVRCERYPRLLVFGICRFADGEAEVSEEVAERLVALGPDYGIEIGGRARAAEKPPTRVDDLDGFDVAGETIAAVINHVGGDAALAREALDAEREASRPRSRLISQLEAIVGNGSDEDEDDGAEDDAADAGDTAGAE